MGYHKSKKFGFSEKVDLADPDQEEAKKMISAYKQKMKKEVPLVIDDKLTIMVAPEKCNEKYRCRYIDTMLKS